MAALSSFVSFVLLALFGALAVAIDFSPMQTNFGLDQPDYRGWTPAPTQAPHYVRRQDHSTNTSSLTYEACGFVSGNVSQPIFCSSPYLYCALEKNVTAIACCQTRALINNSVHFDNCQAFTTCYDTANPPPSSTIDPLAGFCMRSSKPYCGTYVEKATVGDSTMLFSTFGCVASKLTGVQTILASPLGLSSSSSSSPKTTSSRAPPPVLTTGGKPSTSKAEAARLGGSTYSDISTSRCIIFMSILVSVSGVFMVWL